MDKERIDALIEAAEPFAKIADEYPDLPDDMYESVYYHDITMKHYRALRKAIEALK